MHEPSIEDPEIECFAQHREDMDFEGLLNPVRGVGEPSLEDTMLESFAQIGYDVDFDELVEQAEAILDPVPESQAECGEIIELPFPHHILQQLSFPSRFLRVNGLDPFMCGLGGQVWPWGGKRITSCSKLVFKEDGQGAFITVS
jgi:hypothetical protein